MASPESLLPVVENVKAKIDILDWEQLPPQTCAMNFRLESGSTPVEALTAAGTSITITFVVLNISLPLPNYLGPMLGNIHILALAVFLGGALCLAKYLFDRKYGQVDMKVLVGCLLAPPFVSLVGFLGSRIATLEGALVYWLLPLPWLAYLADRIASHGVFWMTANPDLNLATLLAWRRDWFLRFQRRPDRNTPRNDLSADKQKLHRKVLRVRRAYAQGFLWLTACWLGTPLAVGYFNPGTAKSLLGFHMVTGTLMTLLLVGLARTILLRGAWRVFGHALFSWANYARKTEYPPWVLQSPAGSIRWRRGTALVTLFLITTATLFLANYFIYFFVDNSRMAEIADRDFRYSNFTLFGWTMLDYLFGNNLFFIDFILALACCLVLPLVLFVLACFVVAGPVLAAHHLALEAPDAYEKP